MRYVSLILAMTITLSACGGRAPMPISANDANDANLSCAQIEAQIIQHQAADERYNAEQIARNRSNVRLGIFGSFLIIPLFFIDIEQAPEIERAAVFRRVKVLKRLADNKKCDFRLLVRQGH